ncbi:MAG TPA: glycosyltransferase family 4 protein [Methanothrix sp.]|nr:glycosyltransferase family 4 protein [Methanothrix sp.]
MKIAYVHDVLYPSVKGGAEKRVWEVSRRLADKGHEVHIFTMRYWDGGAAVERDGVHLHGICRPGELYVGGRRSIAAAIRFSAKFLQSFRGDYDVIDAQEFPYLPCFSAKVHSKLKRAPLVITWHEVWGDYWREYLGMMAPLGMLVEKETVRLPQKIIPVSERVREDLARMGVEAERMEVVGNGVDLELIRSVEANEPIYDVIYAGRLSAHKRVDLLIEAVGLVREEIPGIRCGIVGDGPEMAALTRLAEELNLAKNVDFLGFLDEEEEVIAMMKSSKILVLPSMREGFGISVLEANACGLPAVVVDAKKSAAADLIQEGVNGAVCDPSAGSIASKIAELLGSDSYKQMSSSSRDLARRHGWDQIAKKVEDLYGGL